MTTCQEISFNNITDHSMRITALRAENGSQPTTFSQSELQAFDKTATDKGWKHYCDYASKFGGGDEKNNSLLAKHAAMSLADFLLGLLGLPLMVLKYGRIPAIGFSLAALAVITTVDELTTNEPQSSFKDHLIDYGMTFAGHLATTGLGFGMAYLILKSTTPVQISSNRIMFIPAMAYVLGYLGLPVGIASFLVHPLVNMAGNKIIDHINWK